MKRIFDRYDYNNLMTLADDVAYAGFRPGVIESPDGNGLLDDGKVFLHVALKYKPPSWAEGYLARAYWEVCKAAEGLGVPAAYFPKPENSTLRVLYYPPEVGSHPHRDFSLFTLTCYRDPAEAVVSDRTDGIVIGELGELVGLGPATRHHVVPSHASQASIVMFALPAQDATLPSGISVREWVAERSERSRYFR